MEDQNEISKPETSGEETPETGEPLPAEGSGQEGENAAGEGGSEGGNENEENAEDAQESESSDYAALAERDLAELKAEFPELAGMKNIAELEAAMRYAELRDLGLSPKEAYLATAPQRNRATASLPDNRRHLSSGVPKRAVAQNDGMSYGEMNAARELFSGLTDGEIRSLYRRVTAQH